MDVDVHEGVEDGLHELVPERGQHVVEQLDPLQAVQVLEGRRRDVLDPVVGKQNGNCVLLCFLRL